MGFFPITEPQPRFELGQTVATIGVKALIDEHGIDLSEFLRRHHRGDWGDLGAEDKKSNEDAVRLGSRIMSKYLAPLTGMAPAPIYIITEHDRSVTTILLTSEY